MSLPNPPAEDAGPEGVDPSPEESEDTPYGSLSIEDDPDGTVDPGELAGGATEDDQDVS